MLSKPGTPGTIYCTSIKHVEGAVKTPVLQVICDEVQFTQLGSVPILLD